MQLFNTKQNLLFFFYPVLSFFPCSLLFVVSLFSILAAGTDIVHMVCCCLLSTSLVVVFFALESFGWSFLGEKGFVGGARINNFLYLSKEKRTDASFLDHSWYLRK